MFSLLPLALLQSLLLAIGQVLLKFGLTRMEPFGWNSAFFRSVLVNWQFAASGISFVFGSLLWMYIVKRFPFSMAYPMVSLSYVFGLVAAVVFFHESVDLGEWIGVALIIGGCCLIAK